jgi:hypothetical protein
VVGMIHAAGQLAHVLYPVTKSAGTVRMSRWSM